MYINQNQSLCEFINQIELKTITFGHAVVENNWQGKVINSPYSRVYFILKGSFFITLQNGKKLLLKEGGCYLIPSGANYSFGCHSTMEHIFFHIKICSNDDIDMLYSKDTLMFEPKNAPCANDILPLINSRGAIDGIEIKSKLYDIILSVAETTNILKKERHYSPCVAKAIEYIHHHPTVSLTVEQISNYACVSKSTLTKHFRSELNLSITEYVYETVMCDACRLLCDTNITISEISEKFGFCDAFYFSRQFSKRFGIPPRDYRKNSLL